MMAKKTGVNALIRENVYHYAQKVQFCAMIDLEEPLEKEERTTIFIRSQIHPVFSNGLFFRGLSGKDG